MKQLEFGMSDKDFHKEKGSKKLWVGMFKETKSLWFEEDGHWMASIPVVDLLTVAFTSGILQPAK